MFGEESAQISEVGCLGVPLPRRFDDKWRGGGAPGSSFTRIRRTSVFFYDTVSPNSRNTSTMMVIILASPSEDIDITPASSAYSIALHALRTLSTIVVGPPAPISSFRNIKLSMIILSSLNRMAMTSSGAAKNTLKSSGDYATLPPPLCDEEPV